MILLSSREPVFDIMLFNSSSKTLISEGLSPEIYEIPTSS